MAAEIINRVANSSLVTFDLAEYYPKGERKELDISQWLEGGIVLREKAFRTALEAYNFSSFDNTYVALYCSTEALLPAWASLLVTVHLQSVAKKVVLGSLIDLEKAIFAELLDQIDWKQYDNKPVIIKGCSDLNIPENAFVDLVQKLHPFAKRISYGEACSSVPLFKQ